MVTYSRLVVSNTRRHMLRGPKGGSTPHRSANERDTMNEARLKNGGQFSLETKTTVSELNGLLLINPDCLAQKVQAGLHSYVTVLIQDDSARKKTGTDLETRPFG